MKRRIEIELRAPECERNKLQTTERGRSISITRELDFHRIRHRLVIFPIEFPIARTILNGWKFHFARSRSNSLRRAQKFLRICCGFTLAPTLSILFHAREFRKDRTAARVACPWNIGDRDLGFDRSDEADYAVRPRGRRSRANPEILIACSHPGPIDRLPPIRTRSMHGSSQDSPMKKRRKRKGKRKRKTSRDFISREDSRNWRTVRGETFN